MQPYPPVVGRDAVRTVMEAYFSPGTCVDLTIGFLQSTATLMERDAHWIVDRKTSTGR